MNIKKQLAILAVILCFTIFFTATVSADSISGDAEYTPGNVSAVLSGTTPSGEGAYVTVTVSAPSGVPFYIGEGIAGANGEFEFSLDMNLSTDSSGIYSAYFGGVDLDSSQKETFLFINTGDNASILSAVNTATEGTITTILNNNSNEIANKCGIDRSAGTVFSSLLPAGQTAVYNALTGRNFSSAYDIHTEFERASVLQLVKERGTVDVILEKAEALGLDIGEGSYYATLDADAQTRVCTNLATYDFSLRDTSSVQVAFNKAVYVELINTLDNSNREKLITYISECISSNYTDITLTDYNSSAFTDTNRLDVIKKVIADKNITYFKTMVDMEDSFNLAINAVKNEIAEQNRQEEETFSGHGGGGGGGGGGVSFSADSSAFENKQPVTTVTPEGELAFDDLSTVPWAVTSIEYLAKKGVVNGVSENNFAPDRSVKREEFVKLLIEALDVPEDTTSKTFGDVSDDAWYHNYVIQAYASGLVMGVDDATFGVGQPITREQLCTMVYRAMQLMDINIESEQNEVSFTDSTEISDYAKDAVTSLFRAGIVNGMGDGRFAPKAEASRAMAAKIIYMILERGRLL